MDRLRCHSQLIAKAFVPTKPSPLSPPFADRSPKKSTNFRPEIILEYRRGKIIPFPFIAIVYHPWTEFFNSYSFIDFIFDLKLVIS